MNWILKFYRLGMMFEINSILLLCSSVLKFFRWSSCLHLEIYFIAIDVIIWKNFPLGCFHLIFELNFETLSTRNDSTETQPKQKTTQPKHNSNKSQLKQNTTQTKHNSNKTQLKQNTTQTKHNSNKTQLKQNTTQTNHNSNKTQLKQTTTQTKLKGTISKKFKSIQIKPATQAIPN